MITRNMMSAAQPESISVKKSNSCAELVFAINLHKKWNSKTPTSAFLGQTFTKADSWQDLCRIFPDFRCCWLWVLEFRWKKGRHSKIKIWRLAAQHRIIFWHCRRRTELWGSTTDGRFRWKHTLKIQCLLRWGVQELQWPFTDRRLRKKHLLQVGDLQFREWTG